METPKTPEESVDPAAGKNSAEISEVAADPVEPTAESKPSGRKIETGLILGVIALVINIITVTVYISQTAIMRNQQRAAAWPRLEWRFSYIQDEDFHLEVNNNGIGPALINSVQIRLDGKPVEHLDSIYVPIVGTRRFPRITGRIENRVLPPGQTIYPLKIIEEPWAEKFYYLLQESHQLEYDICYESVYGEKWTCKGLIVVDGECR